MNSPVHWSILLQILTFFFCCDLPIIHFLFTVSLNHLSASVSGDSYLYSSNTFFIDLNSPFRSFRSAFFDLLFLIDQLVLRLSFLITLMLFFSLFFSSSRITFLFQWMHFFFASAADPIWTSGGLIVIQQNPLHRP